MDNFTHCRKEMPQKTVWDPCPEIILQLFARLFNSESNGWMYLFVIKKIFIKI